MRSRERAANSADTPTACRLDGSCTLGNVLYYTNAGILRIAVCQSVVLGVVVTIALIAGPSTVIVAFAMVVSITIIYPATSYLCYISISPGGESSYRILGKRMPLGKAIKIHSRTIGPFAGPPQIIHPDGSNSRLFAMTGTTLSQRRSFRSLPIATRQPIPARLIPSSPPAKRPNCEKP